MVCGESRSYWRAWPSTAACCSPVPRSTAERMRSFPLGKVLWQPVVMQVKPGPPTSLPRTHLLDAHSQQCSTTRKRTIKPIPSDNPPWMYPHTGVSTAVHGTTACSWEHRPPDTAWVLGCPKHGGEALQVGSPSCPTLTSFFELCWKFSFPDL